MLLKANVYIYKNCFQFTKKKFLLPLIALYNRLIVTFFRKAYEKFFIIAKRILASLNKKIGG